MHPQCNPPQPTSLHTFQCAILSALDRNDTAALNQLLAERDDRYPIEED